MSPVQPPKSPTLATVGDGTGAKNGALQRARAAEPGSKTESWTKGPGHPLKCEGGWDYAPGEEGRSARLAARDCIAFAGRRR